MSFNPDRISDPEFINDNRTAAHSDHRWFRDAAEAATGVSSFEESLNGLWRFHHAQNLAATIAGFEQPGFDVTGWDQIPVPAHVQLHGYDRPQYSNVQYPWDGLEELEPGQVPASFNPVASYVRDFTVSEPLAIGERLSVVFHGAESGIAVWVNGAYVGWSTDSFTPSEFDITAHVRDGHNRIAAQVFKWTAGSWLEDQDFFRFHGLFRDVTLVRRPAVHLEDLRVTTTLSEDCRHAEVAVDVTLSGSGGVRATLGSLQLSDAGASRLAVQFEDPHLWSAENPYLYDLLLEVCDEAGVVTEVVRQRVGVRRVDIVDGILRINGERVVFHGVNRHEFGRNGRAMTAAEIEEDILLIKRAGIDSVRTSHYPNASVFYELCDTYGLYVIDEMNLETHAMWDRIVHNGLPDDEAFPGDRPEWRAALLDRAASMVERDKNHPSVIIWSCGNESYGGGLILEVSEWFHKADASRPVHYEGVHWDPRYPDTSDITSQMYTPAATIEEHLAAHKDKPFILCEYAHSMGNSFGAVDKYLDLADREPHFQGGFIWDFADQTLELTDRYGNRFAGYGGDFGESPTDYDFSANGIVFADRSPKPALEEVRYLYQPFRTRISATEIEVHNRRRFTGTGDVVATVELAAEGRVLASAELELGLGPAETRAYPVPFAVPVEPGEYTVTVEFRLAEDALWAAAGHLVGWEQAVFGSAKTPVPTTPIAPPRVANGIHNIGVHGESFSVLFSRLYATPVSYRFGPSPASGRELLRDRPFPSFWHAPTSNERGWGMPRRDGQWLLASRYRQPLLGADQPQITQHHDSVELTYEYSLPTVPVSTSVVSYRVFGDGTVAVTMSLTPGEGLGEPPEFGLPITVDAELHTMRWYGDGPHESYSDRRGSARLGVWSTDVADALTPYVRPQESGSRTGVRWVEVTDDSGAGIRLESEGGMEFSALPWTPFEVENALHPNELPATHRTTLRPALARRGVGGDNSWGAMTHPEFELPTGELKFRFSFRALHGDT